MFTDIEDSTPWNRRLGDERWLELLSIHHGIIRDECAQRGGIPEGEAQGDGFLFFFDDCAAAVASAAAIQRKLNQQRWPDDADVAVRVGLHTGVVNWSEATGRTGLEINRASRVMSAAHGRQVLLSEAARIHLGGLCPKGTELVAAGSYRLKGFGDEAESLHELVVDGIPGMHPLRAEPASSPSHPRYDTPFVGRQHELDELRRSIASGSTPLTTLVGPGGVGKTRLATEILARQFDDGGVFVDLSKLDEPSLFDHHLASTLGLPTSPLSDPIDLVIAELKDRSDTIVLDNFEQVLPAAGMVERLVEESGCQLIVTSRLRLGVQGESVHHVGPLPVAEHADSMQASPSARLFLTAMGREVTGHTAVAEDDLVTVERLCERLEGLPLAIELAAARAELIGLDGLESALEHPLAVLGTARRDRPKRHRSITDTVAWSFDLLPDEAQQVLLRLSLLPGGCAFDQVGAVCGLDGSTTLNALELLVDAQLLHRETGELSSRFRLPRLIREYGAQELDHRGETVDARLRVAELLVGVAAAARSSSHGRDQVESLARVDDELDNIRALFGWGLTAGPLHDASLQVAAELVSYWWARYPEEGLRWLQRLIDADPDTNSPFLARALVRTAFLASWRGEADVVIDYATRGIEACRRSGRRRGTLSMGLHLRALAWAALDDRQHWRLARRSLRECQAIDRTLKGAERAIHQTNVADVFLADGRLDDAEALYRESLAIFEARGESWFRAAPTSRLGEIALRRRNLPEARRLMAESVVLWQSAQSSAGRARAIAGLARVSRAEGRTADSHRLTTEAWSVMSETKSTGEAPWVVAGLAALTYDQGDAEGAARLLGGALNLARAFGQPVARCIEAELPDVYQGCLDQMGRRAFERALSQLGNQPAAAILNGAGGVLG